MNDTTEALISFLSALRAGGMKEEIDELEETDVLLFVWLVLSWKSVMCRRAREQ